MCAKIHHKCSAQEWLVDDLVLHYLSENLCAVIQSHSLRHARSGINQCTIHGMGCGVPEIDIYVY